MDIQILSPTSALFSGNVDSVLVPGKDGTFHMLNNHAPIVSVLGKGDIQLYTHNSTVDKELLTKNFEPLPQDSKIYGLKIKGGVIELNQNKLIILVD